MRRIASGFIFFSLILMGMLTISLFLGGIAYAGEPLPPPYPPDYACRGCHGENRRTLTLPSGESLPLLAARELLDESVHNSSADQPIYCMNCHVNPTNYRYPHYPTPAQTLRDHTRLASEECTSCHYPHNPLHESETDDPALPVCADCHDSHNVQPIAEVADVMPAACISCHDDQPLEWALELIAPRPGLGEGASGYVGSARCSSCHDQEYYAWRDTLHANMIQDLATDPDAVVGDFDSDDPERPFALSDVAYTIGGHWKQQYIHQSENGELTILPAQWIVESATWTTDLTSTAEISVTAVITGPGGLTDWRRSCSGCHVTGLDTERWEFTEFGVGCESCHGPGESHVEDPENVDLPAVDEQVCGACHSRGVSPDGHAFPSTYQPGDALLDHFTPSVDPGDFWPDGSAKRNHQQYTDWSQGSRMALATDTSCVTCHASHGEGVGAIQLVEPLNDLCLECHSGKTAIIQHTPYHDRASLEQDFTCADCHLPAMGISAVQYDIHNHSMLQPNPQASIDYGGADVMPNSCNQCHTRTGEDPQWAVETIDYVAAIVTPIPENAFAPGPTPTSPPPPTAIPSVGEPAPDVRNVEVGRWIRLGMYVLLGLILLAIVYLIYRGVRSGSKKSKGATDA